MTVAVMPLSVKGVYFPDLEGIVLADHLTETQSRTVLAHYHLGHHRPNSRVELDRLELRAHRWAAVRLVDLQELKAALRGADSIFEVAEALEVDPELLEVRLRWLDDKERRELECDGQRF